VAVNTARRVGSSRNSSTATFKGLERYSRGAVWCVTFDTHRSEQLRRTAESVRSLVAAAVVAIVYKQLPMLRYD
jgi:hypothetical protein